jgi:hypothetical protein
MLLSKVTTTKRYQFQLLVASVGDSAATHESILLLLSAVQGSTTAIG